MNSSITLLQQKLINRYQKGFPICSSPYRKMAEQLNYSEHEVIEAINDLQRRDILSRLGPVFDHKRAGASTLAAIAAPEHQLKKIASIVNQFDQVNHNYEREHHYNLWFVVTALDQNELERVLSQIELLTGLPILVLPMEASYHIDLGFNIDFSSVQTPKRA